MICREEEMPSKATIMRWMQTHEDFRWLYATAKEMALASFAQDILAIADDASEDTITRRNGRKVPNRKRIRQAKMAVSVLKSFVERLMPKKYGARRGDEGMEVRKRGRRMRPARRRRE